MADVDARGHGGDGHGDPPPGGWQLASGCAGNSASKRRGNTKNKGLREMWEKNHFKQFPIRFDLEDQGTVRPVGTYAKDFKALLGVTIRTTVPFTFDSWENVPEDFKTAIWPQLETFFNLAPYLNNPEVCGTVQKGVMKLAAGLYSRAKNHFKDKHFLQKGGHDKIDELRQQQPPPANLSPQLWNELIDYYCRADNVRRSNVNSENRAHHHYPSRTGTKAFVETRYERRQMDGHYPSLIDGFREHHSKNGTIQMPQLAQEQYDQMTNLLRAQQEMPNPMTEEQIVETVLGPRRGFNRGRGQAVKPVRHYHSSSSPSPGPSRVYTQAEVDEMMARSQRRQSHLSQKLNHVIQGLAQHDITIEFSDNENDSDADSDSE